MRTFLWRSMTFFTITLALYCMAMAALCHIHIQGTPIVYRTADYYTIPGGVNWQRFHEFDKQRFHDVVILGSSHAGRGYDPHVFESRGYSAYTLGSANQTPLNSYQLLKYYLDKSNCGMVIFDAFDNVFWNDGLECTSKLSQNQPDNRAAIGMAWALQDLRCINLLGLRFLSSEKKPYFLSNEYKGLGFQLKTDSIKAFPGPVWKPSPLLDKQCHYFEKLVDLCKEREIRLVVSSQYARNNLRGSFHAPLATYLAQTLTGSEVPYLDFTDAQIIDELNWFADGDHLNGTGAKFFTQQLVDSLEAIGYLGR